MIGRRMIVGISIVGCARTQTPANNGEHRNFVRAWTFLSPRGNNTRVGTLSAASLSAVSMKNCQE